MSINRICAAITFAFLTLAADCIGQTCNPHPLRPSLLPPCPTVGSQLADAVGQAQEINKRVAEMNAIIEGARRAFWKVFPDGPGFAAAEAAFSNVLWQKDEYYFILSYPQGVTGDAARIMNVITFTPGMTAADYQRNLHSDPKNIDGGIRRAAYPLFVEWINALRRAGGAQKDGQMANPIQFLKALTDRSNRRLAYEQARNWAEFEASGLDLAKYLTPKAYIQMLMQTGVSIQFARAKTADMPDGQAATLALYDLFVKSMGEQEVLKAATAVLHAPRNPAGGLERYFSVEIGTDVREASYDPFLRFLSLLTENPRNYAIALSLDQNALLASPGATYSTKETWSAAVAEYNRLVAKYGESAVLNVAAKLKAAQKSPTGGIRGDPQVRSVLVWFDAALNDPKTVIPDGKLPHFRASSFDSRWIGKYLTVRGTVSRVDLDTDRRPFYATIHFKESSNNGIMGFSPNSSMLQSKYGKDFSGLVGRPVEIWGYVGNWREGAGVRILDLSQVSVVDSGFSAADADSKPNWLNQPGEVLVDSPKYLAWKKFAPGAKASYSEILLHEREPNTDQYTRSEIARFTLQLESIDDKRAVVRSEMTVFRMADNGRPSNSPANRLIYKAKVSPSELPATVVPNESGDETLEIGGRKIATHWQSVWAPANTSTTTLDPQTFEKTWTSDEVPGGLVLSHKQSHSEILPGKTYRSISQTILEPAQGVAPNPSVTPPAGPNREVPARETRSQPIAGQPPPPSVSDSDRATHAQPAAAVPASAGASPAMRDLSLRYAGLVRRSAQAKAGVAQIEQQLARQRLGLRIDIVNARSRMDTQLRTALGFIGRGDADQAEQSLQYAEAALGILEKFLAR